MKTLRIDLATTILDDRMKVHLVRPGARYAFYDTVAQQSVLPVDAPFLNVPDGQAVPGPDAIAAQLERARVLREWAKTPRSRRKARPSVAEGDYRLGLSGAARSGTRTRIRNAANQVLWDIPGGTVIVIPSRNLGDDAILARIASRSEPRVTVKGTRANANLEFPARRLGDLMYVPMRDLPRKIADAAGTVKVVEEITGHAEDRVLRMYFGDYQRSSDFVTGLAAKTEDFDARVIGQMIEIHMAMEHVLETRKALGVGEALFSSDVEAAPLFHARVDSPNGKAFLESARATTFALKLLVIVAASGLPAGIAAQAIESGSLIVENSSCEELDGVVSASKQALVDFARISGYACIESYLEALQDGLNRNDATIAGKAVMQ